MTDPTTAPAIVPACELLEDLEPLADRLGTVMVVFAALFQGIISR